MSRSLEEPFSSNHHAPATTIECKHQAFPELSKDPKLQDSESGIVCGGGVKMQPAQANIQELVSDLRSGLKDGMKQNPPQDTR